MTNGLLKKNLLVFIGAGLGGAARYGLGLLIVQFAPGPFPWGTFVINVTGCFAMGGLMYLFRERGLLSPNHRLFLMVGILGGYTTFSSFGYESDALMRKSHADAELAYALLSMVLGVAAVWAGRTLTQQLERKLLSAIRTRRKASPESSPAPSSGPLPLEEEVSE
jgi:CrcB protein